MKTFPRISSHAVTRYQERVDQGASRLEARLALQQLVAQGRVRPTPRHWMRDRFYQPGVCFIYWSGRPGVCALLVDDAVVTVKTRALCQGTPRPQHLTSLPRPSWDEEPKWRWNGLIDVDEAA